MPDTRKRPPAVTIAGWIVVGAMLTWGGVYCLPGVVDPAAARATDKSSVAGPTFWIIALAGIAVLYWRARVRREATRGRDDPSRPIEPPQQPTDNPATWSQRARTIGLWAVGFVGLLIVKVAFDLDLARVTGAPLYAGAAVVVAAGFAWMLRRQRRGQAAIEAGVRALEDGKLGEATRTLSSVAHRYRRYLGVGPQAMFTLAQVHLRSGDLDAAAQALAAVERWRGLPDANPFRLLVAIQLVETFALRGDQGLARRWLDEARARLERSPVANQYRHQLPFAELLLLARGDDPAAAIAAFEASEALLARSQPLERMRIAWLLHAFARWRLAGPRDEGTVAPLVRKVQDAPADAFAHLYPAWPELRAFVETHVKGAP